MNVVRDLCENQLDIAERAKRIRETLKERFPEQEFRVSPILTTSKRFPFPIDSSSCQYPWIERILANGGFIEVFWIDGISQQRVARILSEEKPLIDFRRDVSPRNWNKVAESVWSRFPEQTFQNKEDLTFQIFVDHEIWKTDFPST
jgi:hypothetical protein